MNIIPTNDKNVHFADELESLDSSFFNMLTTDKEEIKTNSFSKLPSPYQIKFESLFFTEKNLDEIKPWPSMSVKNENHQKSDGSPLNSERLQVEIKQDQEPMLIDIEMKSEPMVTISDNNNDVANPTDIT